MIELLNGARLETLCALEMFGHVWQFCVFFFPHLGVRLPRCTIQRRDDDEASAGLKKKGTETKVSLISFPFDGLMGARYTNGCLCIPVISCESSACVFPAYRCSLAAHIHWIQPISGRLINEQPPALPVGLYPSFLPPLSSAFLPLCPLAIVLRPAKPATICRWAVVYTQWNKAMYTPARRPRQESRLHLPYLFFSAPPFCWPAFCYLRKRVLEALFTVVFCSSIPQQLWAVIKREMSSDVQKGIIKRLMGDIEPTSTLKSAETGCVYENC